MGLLNLTSLTKADVAHSALWSENFTDGWARDRLSTWLKTGELSHETSHVHNVDDLGSGLEVALGEALAAQLIRRRPSSGSSMRAAWGCTTPSLTTNSSTRSASIKSACRRALLAEMARVSDDEARAIRSWLDVAGMTFHTGTDEATELTDAQLLSQFKMYISALRMSDDFGLDAVGIQYQQGLKDVVPSDLAEGLLNNVERPPSAAVTGPVFSTRVALPRFNEVDEGAAVDSLITNRIWTAMGLDPATTSTTSAGGKIMTGGSCGSSRSLGRFRRRTTAAMTSPGACANRQCTSAGRWHPQWCLKAG